MSTPTSVNAVRPREFLSESGLARNLSDVALIGRASRRVPGTHRLAGRYVDGPVLLATPPQPPSPVCRLGSTKPRPVPPSAGFFVWADRHEIWMKHYLCKV